MENEKSKGHASGLQQVAKARRVGPALDLGKRHVAIECSEAASQDVTHQNEPRRGCRADEVGASVGGTPCDWPCIPTRWTSAVRQRPLSGRYDNDCTYAPTTLPNCDTELMNASATARFAGGLGKTLESQPKSTAMPAYTWTMRNLVVSLRQRTTVIRRETSGQT